LVVGDSTLGGNCLVNGGSVLSGDASFNSRLFVGGDASFNGNLSVLGDISLCGNLHVNFTDNSIPSSAIIDNLNTITNQTLNGNKVFTGVITSSAVAFADYSVLTTAAPAFDNSLFARNWNSFYFTNTQIISNAVSDNGKYILVGTNNGFLYSSANYGISGSWTVAITTILLNWYSVAISNNGQYQLAISFSGNYFNGFYLSNNFGKAGSWVTVPLASLSNVSYSSVNSSISATGQYIAFTIKNTLFVNGNYGSATAWASPLSSFGVTNDFTSCRLSANGKYMIVSSTPNLYVSNNYGVAGSWTVINAAFTSSIISSAALSAEGQYQTIVLSPGLIYGSTSYGVSGSWLPVSSSLGSLSTKAFNTVSMSSNGQYQVASSNDNYIFFSTNYGSAGSWNYTNRYANETTTTPYSSISVSSNGQYILFNPSIGSALNTLFISTTPLYSHNVGIGGFNVYGDFNSYGTVYVNGAIVVGGSTIFKTDVAVIGNLNVGNVVTAQTFKYSSDRRIKTGVESLDSKESLSIIREIRPRVFDYIDSSYGGVGGNSNRTCGFIAQEVKSVVDWPVSSGFGFIPNICTFGRVYANDNQVVRILGGGDVLTAAGAVVGSVIKIRDSVNGEINCVIQQVINKTIFIVNKPFSRLLWNQDGWAKVFIYGTQVDDFHTIDANSIFTLTTSAVQELDSEIETLKTKVDEQASDILELKRLVIDLHQRYER
jgi:hypothetical protein